MNLFQMRHMPADTGGTGGGSASAGDKGDGGGAGTGTPDEKITITKAELEEYANKAASARVAREREKYADYDAIKAKASELEAKTKAQEIRDAEAAKDWQRAQELLAKGHQEELAKEKSARDEAEKRYRSIAINQAVASAAVEHGVIPKSLDQVVVLLTPKIELDAAGTPRFADGKPVKDGVKAFLEENLHFVEPGSRRGGSGANNVTIRGANTVDSELMTKPLSQMTREEVRKLGGKGLIARVTAQSETPWVRPGPRATKDN